MKNGGEHNTRPHGEIVCQGYAGVLDEQPAIYTKNFYTNMWFYRRDSESYMSHLYYYWVIMSKGNNEWAEMTQNES